MRGQRCLYELCRCYDTVHEDGCPRAMRLPQFAVPVDAAERRWMQELDEINQEYPWRP